MAIRARSSNREKYALGVTEGDSVSIPSARRTSDRYALLIVTSGTIGLQGLTMVSGIITARILGVEGRGIVALVFALGLMGSQLTFGGSFPNAIAKNLAERRLAARDGLRSIARRRSWLLVLPCLATAAIMLVLQRADLDGDGLALAGAVAVMTFQTIAFRILVGCLQGEVGHLGRMAAVALLPQLLFVSVLSVFWVTGWPVNALGSLVIFFAASFAGLTLGFKALARPTRRKEDELDETEMWTVTRKYYVSGVRPIAGLGLDRVVIGGLLGNVYLGLYAAATAISTLCSTVGSAVSVIVLPRVAMLHTDPAAQRALIRRWVVWAAMLIVLVVVAVEIILAPTIRIAFGPEFEGAIPVARWLVLADGLLGFRLVLIAVLQGQGRGGIASWIEFALTPVMIVAIVLACLDANLPAVGVAMVVTAALSVVSLGAAVRLMRPV